MQIIFLLLLPAAFYFLLMRPQQQRVKNHQALVKSVAIGEEIITAGGIIGLILAIEERDVRLEVAPGVVLRVAKGAIAQKAPNAAEITE